MSQLVWKLLGHQNKLISIILLLEFIVVILNKFLFIKVFYVYN